MTANEGGILVRSGIAAHVRALRAQSGRSQEEIAQMAGVNRGHLSGIETGKQNVTVDTLVKLANGFDVPITYFFAGMENNPPRKLDKETIEYAAVKLPPRD